MLAPAQRGRVSTHEMHQALATPGIEPMPSDDAARRVLTEHELASRWGLCHKTLGRWRTEGRGPEYLKLSGRVRYALSAVLAFEAKAGHYSTSARVNS
jgi:predicted DNA-binding transcriptional regulator AlpA